MDDPDCECSHARDRTMTWKTYALQGGLADWRDNWDVLNQRLYQSNPFYDSRFIEPLLAHFGSGKERLCVHQRGQCIDGMLILAPRCSGTWANFMPSQAQISPVLLEHPEDVASLFSALPGWVWCIELLNQDPDYSNLYRLPAQYIQDWHDNALTIKTSLVGSIDDYWKSRSKNLQKNIKRYINRAIEATGQEPHLVHLIEPNEVLVGLERYGGLESSGWKGEAGTAIRRDNPQGDFYQDVLSRFAAAGNCSVYELYLGNRIAASRLCVSCDEMTVILKTSYDESQSTFAPGRVLLFLVLQEEFQRARSRAVEFYTNATQDQIQWSTSQRHIRHLTLYRSAAAQQITEQLKQLKQLLRPPLTTLQEFHLQTELPVEVQESLRQAEAVYPEWGLDWFRLIADHALPPDEEARFLFSSGPVKDAFAVLPVRTDAKRGNLYALTTFYSSLFMPMASTDSAPAALFGLFSSLVTRAQGWNRLILAPLDGDNPRFEQTLLAMRRSGWLAFPYFAFGNWYLPCQGLSFDEYFANRPSQLRRTVKRKEQKFLQGDRGTLTLVKGGDALEAGIAAYEKIYRSSWKIQEPFPNFMPELIRLCASRGWLRLGIAHYDGEPVAAQVWIITAGRACIYKLAYDKNYAQLSPGTVLSKYLMRHVLDEDRVAEVDYLIGDDDYKKDWMSHRRERWGIVAYNPRTLRGLIGFIKETMGRLFRRAFPKQRKTAVK